MLLMLALVVGFLFEGTAAAEAVAGDARPGLNPHGIQVHSDDWRHDGTFDATLGFPGEGPQEDAGRLGPGFVEAAGCLLHDVVQNYGEIRHRGKLLQAVSKGTTRSHKAVKGCDSLHLCTANITAAGAIPQVLDHAAGRVWFLQEHHLLETQLREKEAKWLSEGHKISLAPAVSGRKANDPKSTSGGVGFAWGPGIVLTQPIQVLVPGRLAVIRLSLPGIGELQCASLYGDVYSNDGATELAKTAVEFLARSGKPGVIAGDLPQARGDRGGCGFAGSW